jgi:hypothetical protein
VAARHAAGLVEPLEDVDLEAGVEQTLGAAETREPSAENDSAWFGCVVQG